MDIFLDRGKIYGKQPTDPYHQIECGFLQVCFKGQHTGCYQERAIDKQAKDKSGPLSFKSTYNFADRLDFLSSCNDIALAGHAIPK